MPKFPEPPPIRRLQAIGPDILALPEGSPLARVFFRGGDHPVAWNSFRFWGPGAARFDHHRPGPAGGPIVGPRGILYAAGPGAPGALAVCVAEVFQETRIVDVRDRAPWFVVFRIGRPLRLLDLRGTWPTRAGASQAISSGSKARARRWSQAIHEACPDLDGLIYPSSMGGGADSYALYERAQAAIPDLPEFHRALEDPALARPLADAAAAIEYGLILS